MRTFIPAVIGAVVFVIWSMLSISILSPGAEGIRIVSQEEVALDDYPFPTDGDASPIQPIGVVVFNSEGSEPISVTNLAFKMLTSLACCLLIGYVMSNSSCSYLSRVLIAPCFGLFALITMNTDLWVDLPLQFSVTHGVEDMIGWTIVGLIMAKLIGTR
ncbi:MAG: hypothetical protein VYA69_00060 [Gemmatimonadota bacterium]|nr:hypothetical protein [Gemmatimonadota bacterium]